MKLILITFFCLLSFKLKQTYASDYATVLMYHRFDEHKYPSTNIMKETFIQHLNFLKENNFNVLPLSMLIDFFRENKSLPEKSVFITIDDAYKSVYDVAYPILKSFNYPFTVFVSTDNISKIENNFMSWKMLKEISQNNGAIENHTSDHSFPNSQSDEYFLKSVKTADKEIKENIGKKSILFSFPYGESSLKKEKLVENLGFSLAFSQHSSYITKNENIFRLPRFSLNEQYGTIERFKMIMTSRPLEVFDVMPKDNLIVDNETNIISFSTNHPINLINCYNSENLNMELNKINEKKLEVRIKEPIINRRIRVNCTYVSKNKIFWYGRMLNK